MNRQQIKQILEKIFPDGYDGDISRGAYLFDLYRAIGVYNFHTPRKPFENTKALILGTAYSYTPGWHDYDDCYCEFDLTVWEKGSFRYATLLHNGFEEATVLLEQKSKSSLFRRLFHKSEQ